MNTMIDDSSIPSAKRPQLRSVATRRRILDAAIGLFAAQGYLYTGTGDIIARSGMTGGAFYHHFSDKESVAEAILLEAGCAVYQAFTSADTGGPALESVIRGTFAVAHLHVVDAGVRVSSQLMHTVGRASGHAERHFESWANVLGAQLLRGQAEDDVRPDIDPYAVGRSVAHATYGAWAVASLSSEPSDIVGSLAGVWDVVLPTIVVAEVEPYFRDYLRRQRRHSIEPRSSLPRTS